MTEIRKLAAILVADVVGSPATMHGAAADARSTSRPPRAKIEARFVKNSCPSLATREEPLSAF